MNPTKNAGERIL